MRPRASCIYSRHSTGRGVITYIIILIFLFIYIPLPGGPFDVGGALSKPDQNGPGNHTLTPSL